MKKSVIGLFFIFLLLANVFIVANSIIISATSDLGALQENVDKLEEGKEQIETLTDEEARKDYVKREWGKILETKPIIGPISAFYENQKLYVIVDPLFKYSVGMEPSVTWLFVLSVLLWFVFLVIIYQSIRYAGDYPAWAVVLVDIAFMCFIGILGVVTRAAQFFIDLIAVFSLWWVQLIAVILLVIILSLMIYFSKYIRAFMLAMKMKRKKQEMEEEKEDLMQSLSTTRKIAKKQSELLR